jgi:hypothetical protein
MEDEGLTRERSEAAQRRRRTPLVVAAVAGVALLAGLGAFTSQRRKAAALARMTVSQASVSATFTGQATTQFRRTEQPEIVLRVVLKDAPLGQEVPLACEWLGPDGKATNESSWTTAAIAHDLWKTHCKMKVDAATATGSWTVRFSQGGRELARQTLALAE